MKRKRYPKEFKEQVIKEVKEVDNVAQVAKRHGITRSTIYNWINKSNHKAWETTPNGAKKMAEYVPSSKEFKEMEKENIKLKELLGDKDLEIAVLRDLIKKKDPGYLKKLR